MKRIDKPAAPQADAPQRESTENMQAAWVNAWSQQFNRSGDIYGRLFAGMRDEFAAFVQKRLDANMAAAQAWVACRNVNDALELQQSWLRCAIEHYSGQGARLSDLCRSAVFSAEPEQQPAQRQPEESTAAPERQPAQDTRPPIQRAAE